MYKRKWTEEQREQRREYLRKWRKGNKEAFAASQAKYRNANRELVNKRSQDWRERNPDYEKQHYVQNKKFYIEKSKKRYKQQKQTTPWILLMRTAKERARKFGLPFDLTSDYLQSIWTTVCPVLGLSLCANHAANKRSKKYGQPHDNSPSIDRLIPSLGYVQGNVKIVSYRANMIKNCGDADEHRRIADYIDKYCVTKPCSSSV